jgi:hypothetical protein
MSFFTGTSEMVNDGVKDVSRYPKRKRAEVSYAPSEDSEDEWQSEDEDHAQSRKKAKPLPKKLPKHKIFPFMYVQE